MNKAECKLTLTDGQGKVLKIFNIKDFLVDHPYPGGAPTARLMVHNRIMAYINRALEDENGL